MKKILLAAAVMVAAFSSGAVAQVPITNVTTNAFDFGANYGGGGAEPGWTNGANAGFGFGAWSITTSGGGSKGAFIGNPSSGGIGGMSAESFGFYANGSGSPSITGSRSISSALAVGQTFSFQWGLNFDSGGGNKGFNFRAGGTEFINLNMASSANVTLNGANVLTAYGTNSFYVGITRIDASTYTIFSTSARNNSSGGGFSTNISSALAADNFQIYASSLQNGDQAQPYFNNFSVTVVPEPSTYALLALSGIAFGGYMIRRRRR